MMRLFGHKSMKKQENPWTAQTGSAIFWILIMIALLAMLTALVNRGTRTGQGMIGTEQARLAATEIMAYANNVANTVRQLRINGCEEAQISFEHTATGAYYENDNAPTDHRCHVFHPDGGAVRWVDLPMEYFADNVRAVTFDSNHCIVGLGADGCNADNVELIMNVYSLKEEICMAVNTLSGLDNATKKIPVEGSSVATSSGTNTHKGEFGPAGHIVMGDDTTATSANLAGKKTSCHQDNGGFSSNYYIFQQVLMAR
jgi:hypothetical protein